MKRFTLTTPLNIGTVVELNLDESGVLQTFYVKDVKSYEDGINVATLQKWNSVTEKVLRGRPRRIEFEVSLPD